MIIVWIFLLGEMLVKFWWIILIVLVYFNVLSRKIVLNIIYKIDIVIIKFCRIEVFICIVDIFYVKSVISVVFVNIIGIVFFVDYCKFNSSIVESVIGSNVNNLRVILFMSFFFIIIS